MIITGLIRFHGESGRRDNRSRRLDRIAFPPKEASLEEERKSRRDED